MALLKLVFFVGTIGITYGDNIIDSGTPASWNFEYWDTTRKGCPDPKTYVSIVRIVFFFFFFEINVDF